MIGFEKSVDGYNFQTSDRIVVFACGPFHQNDNQVWRLPGLERAGSVAVRGNALEVYYTCNNMCSYLLVFKDNVKSNLGKVFQQVMN